MASLGITPKKIIEKKFEIYIASMEQRGQDPAKFVEQMETSSGEQLQFKINELESIYSGTLSGTENALSSAQGLMGQSALIATTGASTTAAAAAPPLLVTLKTGVSDLKSQLGVLNTQYSQLESGLNALSMDLPSPVTSLKNLISTLSSTINIIPI